MFRARLVSSSGPVGTRHRARPSSRACVHGASRHQRDGRRARPRRMGVRFLPKRDHSLSDFPLVCILAQRRRRVFFQRASVVSEANRAAECIAPCGCCSAWQRC